MNVVYDIERRTEGNAAMEAQALKISKNWAEHNTDTMATFDQPFGERGAGFSWIVRVVASAVVRQSTHTVFSVSAREGVKDIILESYMAINLEYKPKYQSRKEMID